MFCPHCGSQINDNAVICVKCGCQVNSLNGGAPTTEDVPNNMVLAIITTLCCCIPLGIVSIIKACQVNTCLASGDIEGAKKASESAKSWAYGGIVGGFIVILISCLLQFVAVAAEGGM